MSNLPGDVTRLLLKWRGCNEGALGRLIPRPISRNCVAHWIANVFISPTQGVNGAIGGGGAPE
jgi:hypothetical protein